MKEPSQSGYNFLMTCLFALGIAGLAKVVLPGMDDQRPAHEVDQAGLGGHGHVGLPAGVGLDVAKVAHVPLGVQGAAVVLPLGVKVSPGGQAVVGEVAVLDMMGREKLVL